MSLFSFPSGRFLYNSTTRKVTPCSSLGTLSVHWVDDQKHISWVSLDTTVEKLDIIVFPQDAKFAHYKDNIFVLWFQTYEEKYFFWIKQEEKGEDKKMIVKKVQEAIDIEQQVEIPKTMEVEEPHDPSPSPAAPSAPSPTAPKIEGLSQLNQILQNIMQKKKKTKANLQSISLNKLLSGETLCLIQQNPTENLLQFLPQGQQDKESIKENIYSPQLQQAVDNLEEALYSDGAAALFHEIGLDLKVLETSYGTEALLRGLVKWAKEQGKEQ